MKVLYLGESKAFSNSECRIKALIRIGCDVTVMDPYPILKKYYFQTAAAIFHYRTGYRFVQNRMKRWLDNFKSDVASFDILWINSGELFGPEILKELRKANKPIVLYNNDDPTGGRDGRRFDSLLRAMPYYDLCAVLRQVNIEEYRSKGAKNVIRIHMSYDEVNHRKLESVPDQFRSDVAFIGTWMADERRDEFIVDLINNGIHVNIWGAHWQKSPLWHQLAPFFKGNALTGANYVAAIQGAKMCLGFLSKKNRDLHTRRSVEIPFIGGLLCAERTTEHTKMYIENQQAVFWSDVGECIDVCKRLLENDAKREEIRLAGRERVLELNVGNEDICRQILTSALALTNATKT